jgi:hypothetical protein
VDRRVFAGVVAASLCFGLFTTYEHVIARGMAYFAEGADQYQNYVAMFDGRAGNPIQYRILAAWLEALLVHVTAALGVASHFTVSFIALRVLIDSSVFLLAFAYWRRLGLALPLCFVGMSLLAWGMSYGHHNTDLRFDSYLDVSFYLAAGLCLLSGREAWVVPLCALAALNRETSGLIPLLVLAHGWARGGVTRRDLALAAAGFALWAAVLVALRLAYPGQALVLPVGVSALGLPLFAYNLSRSLTYVQLFAVLGIVPVLALAGWARWPRELRAFFWAIVPVWAVIHAFAAVVAEARLFLVPQALVFVPGALFLASAPEASRSRPQ